MTDVVDYLVLSMNTASEANSVYSWQIPKAYYSDQRSSVCKVELIQFNHTKGSHHDIAYVSTNLGLQNQYNAQIDGRNVLAVLSNPNNSLGSLQSGECMRLLTDARPSLISLAFNDNASPNVRKDPATFVATLKFTYFNPVETTKLYLDSYTPQIYSPAI